MGKEMTKKSILKYEEENKKSIKKCIKNMKKNLQKNLNIYTKAKEVIHIGGKEITCTKRINFLKFFSSSNLLLKLIQTRHRQ